MRDLNILLTEHPAIEQANFKLWMASAGVLERIVRSGLWHRSEALMEEIQDRVQMYVPTRTYQQAVDMLEKNSVCVLTGAPGVGKSMLADMLALTHWVLGRMESRRSAAVLLR
jgi:Mrp family chromosome partitioning ATPase